MTRPNGRLARFAFRHRWVHRLLRRFGLVPNVVGPFYRNEAER